MPDDDAASGRESWLGPRGSRKRTMIQIGIGIFGLLLAYLLLRAQRRGAAQADAGYSYPNVGQASGGGVPSGGVDLAAFSDLFAGLEQSIANLRNPTTTPTGMPTRAPQYNPVIRPPTGPTAPVTASAPATHIEIHQYGVVGQSYSLRSVATRFAGSTNPDAIEAMLRRIITANPDLAGRTTLPGGYRLRVPITTTQRSTA